MKLYKTLANRGNSNCVVCGRFTGNPLGVCLERNDDTTIRVRDAKHSRALDFATSPVVASCLECGCSYDDDFYENMYGVGDDNHMKQHGHDYVKW